MGNLPLFFYALMGVEASAHTPLKTAFSFRVNFFGKYLKLTQPSFFSNLYLINFKVIANVKSVVKTEEWIHIEFKVEKLPDPSNDGFFKFETFKKFRDDDSEPPTATA